MSDSPQARMHHFALLSPDEQRDAIRKLAASGMGDYTIAAASGLAVEQVRKIIADHQPTAAPASA